jgi:hypothetical protein
LNADARRVTLRAPMNEVVAAPSVPLPVANRRIVMPRFTLGDHFTREQLDWLDTYGFIRFHGFATSDEVRDLNAEIDAISDRFIAEKREKIFGVPLMLGKRPDGTGFVQRMVFASVFGPKLHAFLNDGRYKPILEVAGPGYRIGEKERDGLVVNTNRNDVGSAYKQLGWHTDSLRDLFYLEKPRRYLNVGFYLTDNPVWRGGVRLLPKTHLQRTRDFLFRKKYFLDHRPDPDEFAIEANAGDLTIHDGRLWHRVARSEATGDRSHRRVMYIPLMEGPLKEKHDGSPTPLYFHLKKLAKF